MYQLKMLFCLTVFAKKEIFLEALFLIYLEGTLHVCVKTSKHRCWSGYTLSWIQHAHPRGSWWWWQWWWTSGNAQLSCGLSPPPTHHSMPPPHFKSIASNISSKKILHGSWHFWDFVRKIPIATARRQAVGNKHVIVTMWGVTFDICLKTYATSCTTKNYTVSSCHKLFYETDSWEMMSGIQDWS